MRRTRLLAVALVATLMLTACGGSTGAFAGHRLENPWRASDVALTDTSGSPYSLGRSTKDHPLTLVFFGYTHCPDFCPLVMNNIAAAFNRLDEDDRSKTGMVFVTSDPPRDTPSVLRTYLDGYNKSFVGLTGKLPAIMKVADSFHVYISDGTKLPSGGYDVGGHTTYTFAVEDGKAVAYWEQSTSAPQFAADIHSLLSKD